MIDTNKYEGHTPGPWLWREATYAHAVVEDRPCKIADRCYDDDCIHWAVAQKIHDRADGLLIADAPLLLAEVKRLREELELYKTRYLKMTEGMDWQEENEMWRDEE